MCTANGTKKTSTARPRPLRPRERNPDAGHDNSYLVIGPWRHGGGNGDGSSLGAIKFDGDTGRWFRMHVLLPFFDSHLKDDAPHADIATVTAFETGANVWRRYDQWPQSCASGCPFKSAPLYLAAGAKLTFASRPRAPHSTNMFPIRPSR